MARGTGRHVIRVELRKMVALVGAWCAAYGFFEPFKGDSDFVAGRPSLPPPRLALRAGPAASSRGGPVTLIKVTPENIQTTASIIGGLAGYLLGGIWVGVGVFTVASYLARSGGKDNKVTNAINGASASGLEAINYVAKVDHKYGFTSGIGRTVSTTLERAKRGPDKAFAFAASDFLEGSAKAIESVDTELKVKDTVATVAVNASQVADRAVSRVVELNGEYNVVDRIKDRIDTEAKSTRPLGVGEYLFVLTGAGFLVDFLWSRLGFVG